MTIIEGIIWDEETDCHVCFVSLPTKYVSEIDSLAGADKRGMNTSACLNLCPEPLSLTNHLLLSLSLSLSLIIIQAHCNC